MSLPLAERDLVPAASRLVARATGTFFRTDTIRQPYRERV